MLIYLKELICEQIEKSRTSYKLLSFVLRINEDLKVDVYIYIYIIFANNNSYTIKEDS